MLYAGSASKTPLYIHALINNSFMESAWRIADGSHTLVKALVDNIESYGGVVLCGKEVSQLVTSQGVATSVILSDGREIRGKRFIANIHPERILDLVEPGIFRKSYSNRIRRLENTMGMFTLYLVFKKNGMPYANYNFYHYNQNQVWVASDYRPDVWPQNYLLMHTAMSRSASFAESGSVITYMDHRELKAWEHTFTGNRGSDYEAFKTEKAEILIDAIEKQFPGIRSRIQAYYTSTPLTWRDYTGTKNGSAYGIIKDYKQPIESLVLPRTQVPNLFLSGQNVNVHGILGVTISAFVTCAEFIDMNYLIRKVKSS
jgi:all-trans-retinol 13,14-reductase